MPGPLDPRLDAQLKPELIEKLNVQLNQPAAGAMQENVTKPAILDAKLPAMAANVTAPVLSANVVRMAVQPAAAAVAAGANVMNAFQPGARILEQQGQQFAAMQGHPEAAEVATNNESYVRLRVRASGDSLQVVSAQEVDGPLVTSNTIVGSHAYEVTLDGKTISAEGLPDLGEQRSFPKPGTNEHFITPRQSFEFNVRVPKSQVPDTALPRLAVTLYKFPDASARVLQGKIAAQPGLQAKAIAQLPALKVDALTPEVNQQLLKVFPKLNGMPR